ncbi:leucyl/phenylalanyl-tRNA--protein transferase [Mucilaginibacter paludis]|uniref:Leucyl/phenylalanyl-tRNA--protein transferase n=1 Tax=Mucilaginibacter paludis DSM 18603 TaxID=714943 RepID=H1YIQ0_9SPHI|nr:leucyl/phenylalanyl-tRNA--protein transferase [Mucilaginibacter paludis]EHQ27595.1 Leucyl/phenylalanyl-tRNA--protein transferase [Mucilaginibacter paludis DSM 18603]
MIFRLDERILFPDPQLAEEDGLLAVGGDLSPDRLLLAYRSGIFPWYSDETPILWYSPHERFVLFPNELKVSKSMRQVIRSGKFKVKFDTAFADVIVNCANAERIDQDGTWITNDMQQAYIKLHQLGHAHSVEVWLGDELAGGLYGVEVGNVFCGESMFSKVSNASKLALITLCQTGKYQMIDCQVYTNHLASLGAGMISREMYLEWLQT